MRRRGGFLFERVLKVKWDGEGFVSPFPSVQKLIDYLWLRKSRSKRSVITYLDHVARFCVWAKMSPDELLGRKREEVEGLVQQYLDEVRKRSMRRGLSARYVNTVLAALKCFFRVNGFSRENNSELRLQGYNQPPRTRNMPEYVPTISEACRMAERAKSKRNRAIIYTLFSTGLRNTSLRAMLVKDIIKEIDAGYENLLVKVEPEWNKRIPGGCKGGIPYFSFTSRLATQAIKEMLEERKEKFGNVKEDEPLFISEGIELKKRAPLSIKQLEVIVKDAAKEANIEDWKDVKPHVLRKVFESVLRLPLSDGDRMDHKDQEFLMGHILSGPQDHYYDWSKVNRLRSEFSKLLFEDKKSAEQESLNIYREMARIIGIDPAEAKVERESELGRLLTFKEEKELLEASIKARLVSRGNRVMQKIILKRELQSRLDSGWKFLAPIDQEHVIVERSENSEFIA